VSRPRLLLVPGFTELEWTIKPGLEEWAEVASFDPPSVGDEPIPPEFERAFERGEPVIRKAVAWRGLQEVQRRGWDEYFLVADGDGNGAAALIAHERPDAVEGIAMGHAVLSYEMGGDRPPINKEIWHAMRQLLHQDYQSFIRHGIVQLTQGSYGDELAQKMVERFPSREIVELGWDSARDEPIDVGEILRAVGCPLLLAKHEGCLGYTPEGYEDAVAAFPHARTASTPQACAVSDEFADSVREFCREVLSGSADAEDRRRSDRAPGRADAR
jgi:hypothetical protein